MACPLHDEILEALGGREAWERKQELWYRMRHDGLKRKRKPYPGAADLHFPLIDTSIEKMKPFYYNQVFQGSTLASFASQDSSTAALASEAAEYHDYVLKERTKFVQELPSMIDYMLLRFRGLMKTWYDPLKKQICTESIDPLYFIMPPNADEIDEADWFVHVRHISVHAYKRDRRYNQDKDVIGKITGTYDESDGGSDDTKKRREGVTYTRDSRQIILWEVYQKTAKGWTVYTYAPEHKDLLIRKPFGLTSKWQGKVFQPFVDFPFEVKDKGWLSPRGIAEKLAPFEAWLCKNWNSKADNMDFTSKPLFTSSAQTPQTNLGKARIMPGELLPPGVSKIDMGGPSMSLDQEMISTRMIAEQSVAMPDVGLGNQINTDEKKTAAEVNQIGALMGQGIEMRGGIFRSRMGELYKKTWALMVQYTAEDLSYYAKESMQMLPEKALHDAYLIHPSGSPDQWNPQKRLQKAQSRFQTHQNNPFVNQEELTRQLLEADDPKCVRKLFQPQGLAEAREAEDEAIEISALLMQGYPAQALPHENHMLRIKILLGKFQQLGQLQVPVEPMAQQLLQQHLMQHLEMLREVDAKAAREVEQMIQQMMQPQEAAPQQQQAAQMQAANGGMFQ